MPFENVLPSIDSVRWELRNSVFCSQFHIALAQINGDKAQINVIKQGVSGLVEFGVRSKLMTAQEGNDWLDVIWRGRPYAEVNRIYCPEDYEEEKDAEA